MRVGVDDLDPGGELEVAGGHVAGAFGREVNGLLVDAVQLDHDPLDVEDDVDDVLDDAGHCRELVLDTFDLDRRDGGAGNAGQQGPAHGVAQRVAESRLQRLDDEPRRG